MVDPSDSIILDKHFSDTIGYTDIPLRLNSLPKEGWQPPPSAKAVPFALNSENQDHHSSSAPNSAPSSMLIQNMYPSLVQNMDALNDPLSSIVSLYEETSLYEDDYSNGTDKEYMDTHNLISHLFNISSIIDSDSSPTEPNLKPMTESIPNSVEFKLISPMDEINDFQNSTLVDTLQLQNLIGDSMSVCPVESSPKIDLPTVTTMHNDSSLHTPTPEIASNKVTVSTENVSGL